MALAGFDTIPKCASSTAIANRSTPVSRQSTPRCPGAPQPPTLRGLFSGRDRNSPALMNDYKDSNAAIEDRIEDLLGRMTSAEKLAQLGGIFPFHLLGPAGTADAATMSNVIPHGIGQVSGANMIGGSDASHLARQVNAIQRYHVEETRLGIPTIVHNEALSGMMYGPAAAFPTAINQAATWQPALVEGMADFTRRQMFSVGVRQALSPLLDVARDARWGRVHETYGEDPVLCAAFGVAFVHGLQGEDLREGVIATAKHFLAYGLSEGALNQSAVHLGPRELYEVFALPFEAAIREADLASVMNSYSEIDGMPVAAAPGVLTHLLRNELGFERFVVADYGSVMNNLTKHRVATDECDAAIQSLEAGLDVELPELRCFRHVEQVLDSGEWPSGAVDLAVVRVLDAKFRLGIFESPYCDDVAATTIFDVAGTNLARPMTEQSIVLLHNDGTLPLHDDDAPRILVTGPFADSLRLMFAAYTSSGADELTRYMAAGLSGSMEGVDIASIDIETIGEVIFGVRERGIPDDEIEEATRALYPQMPTLVEALRTIASAATIDHTVGCHFMDDDNSDIEETVAIAAKSDVVICAVGEKTGWVGQATGGEGRDRATLTLPGRQSELLRAVTATGVPTVAVLVSGRPLNIDCEVSALLWAGAPGLHGPLAIADVIFGNVNPGGKLPVSFPRNGGHTPVYSSHKVGSGYTGSSARGYTDSADGPLYAFGHGLSYSAFTLTDLAISPTVALYDETVAVRCTVENTATRRGSEVVQLYLRDRHASTTRPVRQLGGFARVDLAPGEKRTVTFHFAVSQLALLDRAYRLVIEPGTVEIMLGRSSELIDLRGEITIDGTVEEIEHRGPFFAEAVVD